MTAAERRGYLMWADTGRAGHAPDGYAAWQALPERGFLPADRRRLRGLRSAAARLRVLVIG